MVSDVEKIIKQARKQKEKLLDQEKIIEEQTKRIRDELNKINLDGKLEYFKWIPLSILGETGCT